MKIKAFTLLELLLVVAALGILITAVLVLLDPDQQLRRVEEVNRSGDMQALESALREYNLINRSYPDGITSTATEVCNTGNLAEGQGSVDCTGLLDLRALVPAYITSIPVSNLASDNRAGYAVGLSNNDRIVVSEVLPIYDIIAEGGDTTTDVVIDGTNYRVHTFTSTGSATFTVSDVQSGAQVEYLIVGGGGGGGRRAGGGGGGGGVITGNLDIVPQGYPVIVGAGGSGSTNDANKGGTGQVSSFASIVAPGGGGGGSESSRPGGDGASGGGSARETGQPGGSGQAGFGFSGGGAGGPGNGGGSGGGGGGAGSAGVDAVLWGSSWGDNSGGFGGDGVQLNFNGTAQYYGGGGGGSGTYNSQFAEYMLGGLGGGGNGGIINSPGGNINSQAAQSNTGGGGGGGCAGACSTDGANGGSGVVMIRYRI